MFSKRIFQLTISKRNLPRGSFGRKPTAGQSVSNDGDFEDDNIDDSIFNSTFEPRTVDRATVEASMQPHVKPSNPTDHRPPSRTKHPEAKHRLADRFPSSLNHPNPTLDDVFAQEEEEQLP